MVRWQAAALAMIITAGSVLGGCQTPSREKPIYQDIAAPGAVENEKTAAEPAALPSPAPQVPPQTPPAPQGSPPPSSSTGTQREASRLPAPLLSLPAELPPGPEGELVRSGWEIFQNTPGALAAAAARQGEPFGGSALSCRNCHLDGGTRADAFPLSGGEQTRYRSREGLPLRPAERINACLRRAHNVAPLTGESPELAALEAYVAWAGEQIPDLPETRLDPGDAPERSADLVAGAAVYNRSCASCHGPPEGDDPSTARRDAIPPLWGAGSYTEGSGMNHLLTATAFIHATMPPGSGKDRPALTLEEAYDTAAYVNSFARPGIEGLERDYPALTEKPADCPYPPFADPFSVEQHKYGPYRPILAEWDLYRQAERWVYWLGPEHEVPPTLLGALPSSKGQGE